MYENGLKTRIRWTEIAIPKPTLPLGNRTRTPDNDGVTTDAPDAQRFELRRERERLMTERDGLLLELAQLEISHDAQALRRLSVRLREHAEQLRAYVAALYSFHQRVGVLRP